ncbi:hypothetical protein GCM10020000_16360 [Streptomyces olivoverticillatus]
MLPVGMRAVRLLGDPSTAAYCHAQLVDVTEDAVVGQVRLLDEMGKPLLAIDGLQFTRHNAPQVTEADQWFLEAGWHQAPRRASAPSHRPGNLLIIGEGDGSVRPLADALTEAGARSEVWDTALCDGELEECREFFTDRLASLPEAPRAVVTVCGPGPSVDPDGSLRRTRRLLGIAQAVTAAFTDPPRLFTVTRGARVVESGDTVDPGPGALRGLMRVLALEHPGLKATLVDADPADTEWAQVAGELLADGAEDEIALRGDRRYAARLDYAPVTAAERTRAAACTVRHGEDGFRLRVGSSGDLESLELAATGRRRPGVGEVEVRVAAAGLNFRDVLTAMGLLPGDGDIRYRIGFECAGEVAAVGEGVDRLCVGDRVLAIDLRGGAFGSYLTVPEATVARIPASLDAVAAAGIPVAFLTAWYALHHVGRLGRGGTGSDPLGHRRDRPGRHRRRTAAGRRGAGHRRQRGETALPARLGHHPGDGLPVTGLPRRSAGGDWRRRCRRRAQLALRCRDPGRPGVPAPVRPLRGTRGPRHHLRHPTGSEAVPPQHHHGHGRPHRAATMPPRDLRPVVAGRPHGVLSRAAQTAALHHLSAVSSDRRVSADG